MTLSIRQIKRDTPKLVRYFRHRVKEQPDWFWDICLNYAEKFQRLLKEPDVSYEKKKAFYEEVTALTDYGTAWYELVMFVRIWSEHDDDIARKTRSLKVVIHGNVNGIFDGRSLKRGGTVHLCWDCPLCGERDYEDFYSEDKKSPILRDCSCGVRGQENYFYVHFEYVDPSEHLEPLGEKADWLNRAVDFVKRKNDIGDEEIPSLLGWLQNAEQSGAKEIGELLLKLGDRCLKPVQQIFRSMDDVWVHWLLLILVRKCPTTCKKNCWDHSGCQWKH